METWWVVLLSCAAQLWLRKAAAAAGAEFLVGVGKADMTGPIAEVGMMGYAQPSQTAGGLHLRLFARAFVAASEHAPEKRICFVSMDAGMPSQAQKIALVRKLAAKWPDGRYSARNVMISGTHTHSGPSGFFQYMLFDLAGSLHVNATASAFVDGVYDAIVAADSDLAPASISAARSEVNGANINRSPSSYLRNPAAERSRYKADTDRQLVQLLFTREIAADSAGDERNGISTPFALFNWFAVHPTSMNFTNHLISGDHKGTASQFIEQSMAKAVDESALPGHERSFVAAFASTNLGDVSPNTAGPICKAGPQIGQPCQLNKSTCAMPDGEPAAATYCWSLGPGRDMFESTQIIARKQAQVAEALLANTSAQSPLAGPISFAHSFVNMSEFELPTGERTCPPGLGYSFAGGTTDGPGDAPFYQGYDRPELPELWLAVRDALAEVLCSRPPTKVEYACHAPKPVLLPTGWMDRPWKWHPDIVDVQLFRIGNFVIAGVPGEFTTMSGRRLREALEISLRKQGVEEAQVVVAGLTNLYTQYIATPEEYQAQRYEAASTIYGPNTLPAYISAFEGLVPHLVNGTLAPPGPDPPDLINRQWEGLSAPGVDKVLEGHRIGDVLIQPKASYFTGRGHHDTVINATFLGANPRHALRRGGTFLEVQRLMANNSWITIANDASIATRLYWTKTGSPEQALEKEWPHHIAASVASAERVTGRRLRRARVEACVASFKSCSFQDMSEANDLIEAGHATDTGISELVTQWRPALQAVAAPGGKLETGMYRLVYNGDAKASFLAKTHPFTSKTAPFRIVVVP